MAEALYRKYRPQVFEDVVGQEPIERTLKNAIDKDKVSHAYLFTGPRGTGKTTTARLLAKALLCQEGPTPDPDGVCEDCRLIADGVHPDVYELDAASRTGVENVREEIISRVSFAPTRGRFKVYIIDEVHMLSTAAFNALLKTLEEPPTHVVFVLCTTDPQKVPETIHSRCQRFDFRRIAPEAMVSRLGAICIAEDVEFEGEALDLIAHRAEGGLRNALTSLEQIIAFENGRVTLAGAERLLGSIDSNDMAEVIEFVGKRDIANCFRWTAAYVETGADLAQFVRDMAEHVRNLYVMALVGEDVELDIAETSRLELVGELQWFGEDRLARLLGVLGDLTAELKTSSNPRLAFEIALTRMVRPDSDLTLESLAERVEALESGYSSVPHVSSGQQSKTGFARSDWQSNTPSNTPQENAQVQENTQVTGRPASQIAGSQRTVEASVPFGVEQSAPTAGGVSVAEHPAAATLSDAPQPREGAPIAEEKRSTLANPAALQRIWQASLSSLKRQKQSYGVLFMNTKVHFDENPGVLKVIFPVESAFAFKTVQKPDVQQALANALEKAIGISVPFTFEQMGRVSSNSDGGYGGSSFPAGSRSESRAESESGLGNHMGLQEAAPAFMQSSTSELPKRQLRDTAASDPAERKQAPPRISSDASQGDSSVSYDEVPYEPVPYEDLDGIAETSTAVSDASVAVYAEGGPSPSKPESKLVLASSLESVSDASTAASPAGMEPNLAPNGLIEDDPSNVEELLQAGFGGGVVFTEVDD